MESAEDLHAEIAALISRAKANVAAFGDEGVETERLNRLFERCAKRALRRPDPLARSLALRRFVHVFVPSSLRPVLRRLLMGARRTGGPAAGARR